ncbi:hypothetical protein FSB08_16980 [Paraburkholderia sp. JPY432]|nr:hypothetical protein [Paraburkholderia youngii]
MTGTPACGTPRQVKRLLKPHNFRGATSANFIEARGAGPTTTPDRFVQANTASSVRGCKTGADHRFTCVSSQVSLTQLKLTLKKRGLFFAERPNL